LGRHKKWRKQGWFEKRENLPEDKKTGKKLPINWYNFYVNIRLPLGIVVGFFILAGSEFAGWTFQYAVNFIYFFLIIALFIGLKNRKLWGWKLNFTFLILNAIFKPFTAGFINITDKIGWLPMVLIIALIWTLPNWIYFKKRRYLFS